METRSAVLIVDSDDQLLIRVEQLLEDNGFETVTAWSAEEALEILKWRTFDVLLAGDRLPDSTCEQFMREIQTGGDGASIVVLESVVKRAASNAAYFASLGAVATVRRGDFGEILRSVRALAPNGKKRGVAA